MISKKDFHIVLVEDEPCDVLLFERILERLSLPPHRLTVINDGQKARDFFMKGADPDLVILDLDLPHASGKELLAGLKGDPRYKKTIVIVLSGIRSPSVIHQCYDLGAHSYLVRPSDLASLKMLLHNTMSYWLGTVALPPDYPGALIPQTL